MSTTCDLSADLGALSDDAVLGGALRLLQPRRGHRVGHDAILLAASTGGRAGERAVDLGAGVGAAGLALAWRVPGLFVTLLEVDAGLAALAAQNAKRNGLAERIAALALDVGAPASDFTAAGLAAGTLDRVLMNPPFLDAARQNVSPDARRRAAHVASGEALATWIRTAARLLRPAGVLTLIHRADALPTLLTVLEGPFGAVTVQPVHSKAAAPAIRILVRAVKASRAPFTLLPGLVLQAQDGRPTAEAERVLRAGASLPLATLG